MLTITITHAQCWISIWLVNHSVSECVWHMFGWHTAKQQDQRPHHTHALCPPVLNNGPAKALNICVLTPFKLLQSSADLACKSMCALTLIKDYGHSLVPLMCYLCPLLHSPWETGLPFPLKWSWRSAGESVMQSEREMQRSAWTLVSDQPHQHTVPAEVVWTLLTSLLTGGVRPHILKDSRSV